MNEKEHVPFNIAMALRGKIEPLNTYQIYNMDGKLIDAYRGNVVEGWTLAPLYQQVIDWLWEKHMILVTPIKECLGSDEWEFKFTVEWLPKDAWNLKRRATSFKNYDSFSHSGGGTYMGAWPTKQEALNHGLEYALNLLKDAQTDNSPASREDTSRSVLQ